MDLLTATIIVRGLPTHSSVAQQEHNPRYCLPLWEGPASICQSWRTTPVKHNITIRTLLPISEKSVPLQPKKGNSFNSHHHQFYPRQSCTFSWAFQEHLQNNENYCDRPSAGEQYSSVIICVTLLLPYHYGGTGTMFEYSVAICVTLLYPTTKEIQCLSTAWLFVFICLIPTTDVVQKLPLLYNWVQCYLFYSAWPPTTDKVQCVSTVLLIILLSLTPYH